MSKQQRQTEERRLGPEDCDQLLQLLTRLEPVASLLAQATSGVQSTVPLLPGGPKQAEDENSSKLLAEQGSRQPPGFQTPTRQPRCRTPLPFPQQEEQSASTSVLAAAQEQSYDYQAVAMQESCGAKLSMVPSWEGQVFSLDVSHFVNDSKMLGILHNIWSISSIGDARDIRAQIREYDTRPLKERITVIDAVCTHVPITLGTTTLEDIIGWLNRGLDLCNSTKHAPAQVLEVRLRRRKACIYFRQGMLEEARKEIDQEFGIIFYTLRNCVDVGIADTFWLLAWITLFEVWDNESQFADALQYILDNARLAYEIAQRLPNSNEELRKAYCGRIACTFACLKLVIASRSHFKHRKPTLEKEAEELINNTTPSTLAKRDRSLWCRAKLWLHHLSGESSEQIPDDLSQIILECRGVDSSNNVFTKLTLYRRDIELEFI